MSGATFSFHGGTMRTRLLALALFAYGCGGGTTNNYYILDGGGGGGGNDGGGSPMLCTPGAKDCVTDALARICTPDGTAWIGLQCPTGEICQAGACVFDPNNTSCNPGDAACVSATKVAVC